MTTFALMTVNAEQQSAPFRLGPTKSKSPARPLAQSNTHKSSTTFAGSPGDHKSSMKMSFLMIIYGYASAAAATANATSARVSR